MGEVTTGAQSALNDAEREIREALERLQRWLPAGARIEVAVDWVSGQTFGEMPTYHPRVKVLAVLQSGGA